MNIDNAFTFHVPDRLLDDTLITFDLPEVLEKLKQGDTWQVAERNAITLLKSKGMRIILIALHEQAEINFHQSGNAISVQIIEGTINFKTENQSVTVSKGGLLTCNEDVMHTLIALEQSAVLLTIAIGLVEPDHINSNIIQI